MSYTPPCHHTSYFVREQNIYVLLYFHQTTIESNLYIQYLIITPIFMWLSLKMLFSACVFCLGFFVCLIFSCARSSLLLHRLSLVAELGLLTAVASLVVSMGSRHVGYRRCSSWISRAGAWSSWYTGIVALQHVGSSWTRDGTHIPSTGRQILIHYTTWGVQTSFV